MNKKLKIVILCLLLVLCPVLLLTGCDQSETVMKNIQKEANKFEVYRRMTFINLRTGEIMYSAEGYFSLQDTAENEIGLIFKDGKDSYHMDYFSTGDNVTYVIQQIENTSTNPYHWEINFYVPLPVITSGY